MWGGEDEPCVINKRRREDARVTQPPAHQWAGTKRRPREDRKDGRGVHFHNGSEVVKFLEYRNTLSQCRTVRDIGKKRRRFFVILRIIWCDGESKWELAILYFLSTHVYSIFLLLVIDPLDIQTVPIEVIEVSSIIIKANQNLLKN